jgi:hypothetical protein
VPETLWTPQEMRCSLQEMRCQRLCGRGDTAAFTAFLDGTVRRHVN